MTTSLPWAFGETHEYGRAALIGCLPAGLPDMAGSVRALKVLGRHMDVLEIALVDASTAAVTDAVEVVRAVTAGVSVPVMVRSTWGPIALHGPHAVAAALGAAGAAGLVLPGLHPHSRGAGQWLFAASQHRLGTVFRASEGQVRAAVAASTGWVDLPVAPPEGPSDRLDIEDVRARAWMLASHSRVSRVPICASGYLRPDQAAEIAPAVDAIEIDLPFLRAVQLPCSNRDFVLLGECALDYAVAVRARAGGRHQPAADSTVLPPLVGRGPARRYERSLSRGANRVPFLKPT